MRVRTLFVFSGFAIATSLQVEADNNRNVLAPDVVEETIRAKGGRVDFVFEDKRG